MTRVHGKRGALPRDNAGLPTLEAYLTTDAALPSAPGIVDRESVVSSWPMYANDTVGDCTCAAMGHLLAALTAFSGVEPGGAMFTDDTIIGMYSAVSGYVPGNESTDNGATLAAVCSYMTSIGITDTTGRLHRLAGWAEIGDPTNLPLLKRVLSTFGTVYVAFNLPSSAETQFDDEQPWTYVPGSPIAGGHCVCLQYSAVGGPAMPDNQTFITWGAEQKAGYSFSENYLSEAIAVVSQDWIDANGTSIAGLDLAQLLADSKSLSK